jgi:hypothetical protein
LGDLGDAVARARDGQHITETQAHQATQEAVYAAEHSTDGAAVEAKAAAAKELFAKMVEEQVALGRAKFHKHKQDKAKAAADVQIKPLVTNAEQARASEKRILERVKADTKAVSQVNLRLARSPLPSFCTMPVPR